MKVGFVLECYREGADHQVLRHVVPALRKDIEPHFRFCESKGKLLKKCGEVVAGLFDDERCDRVFVVWDLVPCDPPFQSRGKPSRRKERLHLRAALRAEDCARTEMVCIKHELEAWLLADGTALTAVLSRSEHQAQTIGDDKHPEWHPNPKKVLAQHFKENRRGDYDDKVHALKIIKAVKNLKKLDRAASFLRLREKLAAL